MDRESTHKITVQVHGPDGRKILYRIKESTQLWKLMAAYCGRLGVHVDNVRFLLAGRSLWHYQTPQQVNMEEGDVIHAMLHLRGS